MTRPRFASPLAAVLLAAASAGCSALGNCPAGQTDAIAIDKGDAGTDTAALTYASAPWDGPLDKFPAKSIVSFKHYLGVVPLTTQTFVSFSSNGTDDAGGGDVTENAGNQGRIVCVDSDVIMVKNDTCEDSFYIRVIAYGKQLPQPKDLHMCASVSGFKADDAAAGGASN